MFDLCPPALIYLFFSATQIIIDLYKGLYNTAVLKFIIMIMVTILLNALCQGGLGIISWVIVFIPFIFMTVVVSILLYVFGLNAATGEIKKQGPPPPKPDSIEEKEIILVNPYPMHGMSRYSTINVYEKVTPPPNPNPPPPPPPPSDCPVCKDCPPPPPPNYCVPKPPPSRTTSPAYQSFSKY
jgi:hypothetical protein